MREQIDTIPVNEAFSSGDECPFCYLQRQAEQRAIRYTVGPGASYMEPDVREVTDRQGFCGQHMKKLYDYGNSLGNALVMQTYFVGLLKELEQQFDSFTLPPKKGLFASAKKGTQSEESPLLTRLKERQSTCFLCSRVEYNMKRYFHTFFVLIKDGEFRARVESCKGFCMHHFTRLLELAGE